MRSTQFGLFATSVMFASGIAISGLAGCGLPEVRPLVSGITAGPSPYGPWYEQHWATNAILLAAADNDEIAEVSSQADEDAAIVADAPQSMLDAEVSIDESKVRVADVPPPPIDASVDNMIPALEGSDANAAAPPMAETPATAAPSDGPVRY